MDHSPKSFFFSSCKGGRRLPFQSCESQQKSLETDSKWYQLTFLALSLSSFSRFRSFSRCTTLIQNNIGGTAATAAATAIPGLNWGSNVVTLSAKSRLA